MKRTIKKTISLSERFFFYIKWIKFYFLYKIDTIKITVKEKIIYIDLKSNPYERHLYTLLKYFHLNDYTIFLKPDFILISQIANDPYSRWIFREKLVRLGIPNNKKNLIIINQSNLDANYFSMLLKKGLNGNEYHVPISLHPIMYHENIWNNKIDISTKRINSIFMIGNFDSTAYDKSNMENIFFVSNRNRIFEYLKNEPFFFNPKTFEEFKHQIENSKVILIKRSDFKIPMKELRGELSKFNFFFALPGLNYPLSHNIVEAMSVGTIPLIQQGYASLFRPNIENLKNGIIYNDLSDLIDKINLIFGMNESTIHEMRKKVLQYYEEYLTPHSIVSTIVSNNFEKIYLLSGKNSIEILKYENLLKIKENL